MIEIAVIGGINKQTSFEDQVAYSKNNLALAQRSGPRRDRHANTLQFELVPLQLSEIICAMRKARRNNMKRS